MHDNTNSPRCNEAYKRFCGWVLFAGETRLVQCRLSSNFFDHLFVFSLLMNNDHIFNCQYFTTITLNTSSSRTFFLPWNESIYTISWVVNSISTVCGRTCWMQTDEWDAIVIITPHRSTTYVDAAYSYRPSSVVCRSVCLSVCRSVTLVSPAKTAAPIELPFGLRTWVGPGTMY